jgi:hypothetical protein
MEISRKARLGVLGEHQSDDRPFKKIFAGVLATPLDDKKE